MQFIDDYAMFQLIVMTATLTQSIVRLYSAQDQEQDLVERTVQLADWCITFILKHMGEFIKDNGDWVIGWRPIILS